MAPKESTPLMDTGAVPGRNLVKGNGVRARVHVSFFLHLTAMTRLMFPSWEDLGPLGISMTLMTWASCP